MKNLLHGFAYTGYRSVYGPLQIVGPLGKVNFLAGQNNSGKSNILRYVSHNLRLQGQPSSTTLDLPLGQASIVHEFAVAIPDDHPEISKHLEEHRRATRLGESLRSFLQLKALRLTNDDLIWVRYQPTRERRGRADVSRNQAMDIVEELGQNAARIITTLQRELTQTSGGSAENACSMLLQWLANHLSLPNVATIEAFRQILPDSPTNENGHSGRGLITKLAQLQNPSAERQADKRRLDAINRFVQTVLDDRTAELEIPYERNTINVHRQGSMLPLENLGTGIHQVIIMAAASTILEDHFVCMEEPEVHLHPLLQRKLMRYLHSETRNQYLIATHSAHMLDYEKGRVFHIRHTHEKGTVVTRATTPAAVSMVCADLGYRPSDLIQANAVIWVEGPSDRVYLNHWIRLYNPGLLEGIHYSIMFYGGGLLNHLSANDPEIEEFISLRRLNRNIAIIIDSDKKSPRAHINPTKRRVRDEFNDQSYPGFAWVTDGYTIENYIPSTLISEAVNRVHPQRQLTWTGERWINPLGSIKGVDKVRIARSVCESWGRTQMDPLLRAHINETTRFILNANGLSDAGSR